MKNIQFMLKFGVKVILTRWYLLCQTRSWWRFPNWTTNCWSTYLITMCTLFALFILYPKVSFFFLIYTNQMFDVCDVKCNLHHLKCVKMFLNLLLEINFNISCTITFLLLTLFMFSTKTNIWCKDLLKHKILIIYVNTENYIIISWGKKSPHIIPPNNTPIVKKINTYWPHLCKGLLLLVYKV